MGRRQIDACPRINFKELDYESTFKGRKGKLIAVNHLRRESESSLSSTVWRISSDWLVVR